MKTLLFIFFVITTIQLNAQPINYTNANAHSHNDYEQQHPFYEAWQNNFGSIEADIFLHEGKLLVAHEAKELNESRSLQSLYLEPIKAAVENNKGFPYADANKELQLLIDVKTDSIKTLDKLIEVLKNYPSIISCDKIKITISGNRPSPQNFNTYPAYIFFDGVLNEDYSSAALSKIVMLSDNFSNYSAWNGNDSLPGNDKKILIDVIAKAHALKKKVRFWNAPDNENAWQTFMQLHVDYINTDHIKVLSTFLDSSKKNK